MRIPLFKPWVTEEDIEAVEIILRTPQLSLGSQLIEFEKKLAEVAGIKYAVATNSGTSALHLIMKSLGIGNGDEVITTSFSFIASANCILYEGATPLFVDIDEKTCNINPELVEKAITERTRAILAVDIFGQPAEWEKIEDIGKEYNLAVIEDSCEAIGAEYKGRRAGSFGRAAAFAFYPNKQITTGEGGAVLTDSAEIAKLCRSMRNQGREDGNPSPEHTTLGYNYRISEINCALGISQLRRLNVILGKREEVARMYDEKLSEIDEVITPFVSPHVKMSWFVYAIRLREGFSKQDRDEIIKEMGRRGVQTKNYFVPIHIQPFYRRRFGYKRGAFPIAENVSDRIIALPFCTEMEEETVDFVVRNLKGALAKIGKEVVAV